MIVLVAMAIAVWPAMFLAVIYLVVAAWWDSREKSDGMIGGRS